MNPDLSALAWALIHFLWEGGVIAVLLAVALRMTRPSRADVRYLISCAAMVLMLASACATFVWLNQRGDSGQPAAPVLLQTASNLAASGPTANVEPQKRS